MINDILKLAEEINSDLLKEPLIKEFLELDHKLKTDPNLKNVLNEINYLRKCEENNKDTVLSRNMYKSVQENPLISNYFKLYNEVYDEISNMEEMIKAW